MKAVTEPDTALPPWLQDLPENWDVVQARRLFRERKKTGLEDLPLLSVTQQNGVLRREESELRVWNPGADISGYKLVLPGDFVISLRSFQGGLERSEMKGLISPAYTPFYSPTLSASQLDFLRHYFKSGQFVSSLAPLTSGIRQGKTIPFADFGESPLPIPPPDAAGSIASFLDRETARVDTLIEKKRRLLDLLEEKRTALIARAVTQGLDPDVPMKASGVTSIGEIPEHWDVVDLRRVARVVDCKHRTPTYVPQGYPLVSTTEVKPGVLDLSVCTRFVGPEDFADMTDGPRLPTSGDIIYSRNASLGAAALVETQEPFCMGQDVVLIRTPEDPDYLRQQLNSSIVSSQVESVGVGSTFSRINVATIRTLRVALPPKEEQAAIAAHVRTATERMLQLEGTVTRAIALLEEYRMAVISSAVTSNSAIRTGLP